MSSSDVHEWMPDKNDLLQALQLVGRTPLGEPLDIDDLQSTQYYQLVGILDAAVETLARQSRPGGKGNSRGHHVVLGHRYYVEQGTQTRELWDHYQSSVERLAADMKSASSGPNA